MNIVDIVVRRVFFMLVNDGGGLVEVPIDKVTYDALSRLHHVQADAEERLRPPSMPPTPQQQTSMSELMEQLDHEGDPPAPLPEMPDDLRDKLKSLGFGDELDPGEMLESAGDEVDGDQL